MPHSKQTREFLSFLLWLKKNHPQLSDKYSHNIAFPKYNEGVGIQGLESDTEAFKQLANIQYDYYHSGE